MSKVDLVTPERAPVVTQDEAEDEKERDKEQDEEGDTDHKSNKDPYNEADNLDYYGKSQDSQNNEDDKQGTISGTWLLTEPGEWWLHGTGTKCLLL